MMATTPGRSRKGGAMMQRTPTGRSSRRRKKIPDDTTVKHDDDDDDDEEFRKENEAPPTPSRHQQHRSFDPSAKKSEKNIPRSSGFSSKQGSSRRGPFISFDDDHQQNDDNDGGFIQEERRGNNDSKIIKQAEVLAQEIRESMRRVRVDVPKQITASEGSNISEFLTEHVSTGSFGVPKSSTRLFVQENTSYLLGWARKLIKEVATSTTGADKSSSSRSSSTLSQENRLIHDHLFVAVHVLRMILMTAFVAAKNSSYSLTIEHHESLLKLLYHLTLTSSEASLKEKNVSRFVSLARITYVAYEGLGYTLSSYSILTENENSKSNMDKIQSFTMIEYPSLDIAIKFSIPSDTPTKMNNSSKYKIGTMTVRQLATIAIKTSMALSKVFSRTLSDFPSKDSARRLLNDDSISDDSMYKFIPFLQLQIVRPWLVFLANGSTPLDMDVLKEFVTYCKGSHRLIWDIAATKKTTHHSIGKNKATSVDADCLFLRKDAILMLLVDTSVSKVEKIQRKSVFDNACSYAWKATGVYHQSTFDNSDATSYLKNFYDDIDPVLNRFVSGRDNIPIQYAEYKAYKSQHIVIQQPPDFSLPINLLQDGHGQSEAKDGNFHLMIDFIALCTFLIQRIRNPTCNKSNELAEGEKNISDKILDATSCFIKTFQHQVIEQFSAFSVDMHNQIFKLFVIIGLEKVLHDAVKRETDLSYLEYELRSSSRILVDCVVVYMMKLLSSDKHEMKRSCDHLLECFMRPIAALDCCTYQRLEKDPSFRSPECIKVSDSYCRRLFEMIFILKSSNLVHSFPRKCEEKVAKFLSMTSRIRSEKSLVEESLTIQMYSVLMYSHLESSKEYNHEDNDYQLSARTLVLSNALQATNHLDSSFFAMCAALLYEINQSSSFSNDELFQYLLSKTSNALSADIQSIDLPSMTLSVCRRISSLLFRSKILRSRTKIDKHIDPKISLSEVMLEKAFESLSSVETISQDSFLFLERILSSQNDECRVTFICSFVEVLNKLGQFILQSTSDDDDTKRSRIEMYNELLFLVERVVNSLQKNLSEDCRTLVYIIAATSILPSGSFSPLARKNGVRKTDYALVHFAADILKKGSSIFESNGISSDRYTGTNLLGSCMQMSLRSLEFFLSEVTEYHVNASTDHSVLVKDCSVLVDRLVSETSDAPDKKMLISKRITTWTLLRLQSLLEDNGKKTLSMVLGLLCRNLQTEDPLARKWFTSSVISVDIDGRLKTTSLPEIFESMNERVSVEKSGSPEWIFEIEYELCLLRLKLIHPTHENELSYDCITKRLESIRLEIESVKKDSTNDEVLVLLLWLESTMFLVHSEVTSVFGCYPAALRSTQRCLEKCKGIMQVIGSNTGPFGDWLTAVASSTVLSRATHRYVQVLSRRPKLYYRMGDHRKAMAYMKAVCEFLKLETEMDIGSDESSGTMLQNLVRVMQHAPLSAKQYSRLYLEIKSWASTPDLTFQELSRYSPDHLVETDPLNSDSQIHDHFQESVRDLITVGDILYGDSVNSTFEKSYELYYEEAIARVARSATIGHDQAILSISLDSSLSLNKKIELRNARNLLESNRGIDSATETSIQELCYGVESSELSTSDDKAWALNYLGSIEIEKARQSGALQRLWRDESLSDSIPIDPNIQEARALFHRATLLAFDSSDILARSVARNLALVVGPRTDNEVDLPSAGILILSSIGQSLRRRMTMSLLPFTNNRLAPEEDCSGFDPSLFAAFDSPGRSKQSRSDNSIAILLDELALLVPSNWKFVAPVLCPSGDVLITYIEKKSLNEGFTIRTECVLKKGGIHAYDNILKPLDDILVRLQKQLHNTMAVDDQKKEDEKRRWWDARGRLDDELCELLRSVEETYFQSLIGCVEGNKDSCDMDCFDIETDNHSVITSSSDDSNAFPRRLDGTFENILNEDGAPICYRGYHEDVDETSSGKENDDLASLTVPKLKEKLIQFGIPESDLKRKKKADLLDSLLSLHHQQQRSKSVFETGISHGGGIETLLDPDHDSDLCLFLILDENLHRFPFEGMPHLMGKIVCRVPCLSFVLATLYENQPDSVSRTVRCVDPQKTSFVLDPENNLLGTRNRLRPILRDICIDHDWDWDGVVGQIPSTEFFSQTLTSSHGLLLYFGHGGAQCCFSKRKVEELIVGRGKALAGLSADGDDNTSDFHISDDHNSGGSTNHYTTEPCKAVVVLMGCSSGRLVSVNRKNTDIIEEAPLYYEPEGVALSYLCAGAPCVVGNLWDVTDHDIDRFSISMLHHFLGRSNATAKSGDSGTRQNSSEVGRSLAASVSLSRSACKLRYLVGCAPVCYGVPVHLLPTTNVHGRRRRRGKSHARGRDN